MAYAYLVSMAILSFTTYCHYLSLKPPPLVPIEERQAGGAQKPRLGETPQKMSRFSARHINIAIHPLYYVQFLLEIYGIYLSGTSQLSVIPSFICPSGTATRSRIYQPHGQLPPALIFACASMIAGGLLRGFCYQSLGNFFRWELSIQPSHKLITTGPYTFLRHPAYTGALLVFVGYTTLIFTRGTMLQECLIPAGGIWVRFIAWFMVSYRAYVVSWLARRTQDEDAMLRRQFGAEWDKWAAKTYKMIPFVW